MSTVNIGKESLEDGFMAGNGTAPAAETKVSAVNFPIRKHIVIHADSANGSDDIVVGRVGQAASGFVLHAGDTSPPIYVSETDMIRVYGAAGTPAFSWIAN